MIERATPRPDVFAEYVHLLLRLHRLIAAGKGESEEAEEVRDVMDAPWRQLNSEQLALVDGLSADLYSIGVDRQPPNAPPDQQLWDEFTGAVERYDWRVALDALRVCEFQVSPVLVAYLRAACWTYLGQLEAALEFLREKERLQPLAPEEAALLMNCLIAMRRLAEAELRTRGLEGQPAYPPLLLAAGTALSLCAAETEGDDAQILRQRAVDLLRRAVQRASSLGLDLNPQDMVRAYLHLAANFDALGDIEQAAKACEAALGLDPDSSDAIMFQGWLLRDSAPETGTRRFHRGFLARLPTEHLGPDASSLVLH